MSSSGKATSISLRGDRICITANNLNSCSWSRSGAGLARAQRARKSHVQKIVHLALGEAFHFPIRNFLDEFAAVIPEPVHGQAADDCRSLARARPIDGADQIVLPADQDAHREVEVLDALRIEGVVELDIQPARSRLPGNNPLNSDRREVRAIAVGVAREHLPAVPPTGAQDEPPVRIYRGVDRRLDHLAATCAVAKPGHSWFLASRCIRFSSYRPRRSRWRVLSVFLR